MRARASVATLLSNIALGITLAGLLLWFAYFNLTVAEHLGLNSADDAYFAYVTRNFIEGRGIGNPINSETIALLSPLVSTGPALMLPIGAVISLTEISDFIFGAAVFWFFLFQMIGLFAILIVRFGLSAAFSFMIVLLILLIAASTNGWYFGVYLGEPAALGWLLLGAVLLATSNNLLALAFAGVFLSLAILTKQLALFGVVGIIGGWLIATALQGSFRMRAALVVAAAVAAPLATWEGYRLAALGAEGYFAMLRQAAGYGSGGPSGVDARLAEFIAVFGRGYGPIWLLSILTLPLILNGNRAASNVTIFLAVGTIFQLGYVLFLAPIWHRYMWVGAGIACATLASAMFRLGDAARVVVSVGLVLLLILYQPLWQFVAYVNGSRASLDRASAVACVDAQGLPLAAQTWASLFDILAISETRPTWVLEDGLEQLRAREFLAVINNTFTAREGDHAKFYRAVVRNCRPQLERGKISIYLCLKSSIN